MKHRHVSVNSCLYVYLEQISTYSNIKCDIQKAPKLKWTENNLLPVCWTFFNCSCKGKVYICEKWHIWRIESQPYFTIVYYWFGISIDNLYTPTNKEHLLTLFFWHYVREEEKFENTKGVIRNCKSKKNRQHNSQKKTTDRKINNELQHIAQKTKERATPTLLKPVWIQKGKQFLFCDGRVTLVTIPVISHEWGKGQIVITTNGVFCWNFWSVHFTLITRNPWFTIFLVSSNPPSIKTL